MSLRLLWPPHPFRAGFCITDDTDRATLPSVKAVYDFLLERRFLTSKTVWAFTPEEKCGIPPRPDFATEGVTLENPEYLAYCRHLHEHGFEICLHGASGGNNRRERTEAALRLATELFGGSRTFIFHSKNADNMYWERKVTNLPVVKTLLALAYSQRTFEGEVEGSPYFWGDLCRRHVHHVRLFRTRGVNTLAFNPSMPYYDPRKPYVNGWFGATKRSIGDVAAPEALERLKRERGLTVLYSYLHRYADPESGSVRPVFREAVERIVGDGQVYVDNVARIMARLRLLQGIFVVHDGPRLWLVNTSADPVENLQVDLGRGVRCTDAGATQHGSVLVLPRIDAESIAPVTLDRRAAVRGARTARRTRSGRVTIRFDFGRLAVNLGETPWDVGGSAIAPGRFHLAHDLPDAPLRPICGAGVTEELRMVFGQFYVIAREMLLKGRLTNTDRFYRKEAKPALIHDPANW